VNPTNIVGISFASLAQARSDQLAATMDIVLSAEGAVLLPILKALFLIFIGRQFLLCMYGHLGMERFMMSAIRVGIIVLLIGHTNQFAQQVREPVFNTIPQAIAGFAGGSASGSQTIAAQFDAVSAGADALTASTVKVNTGWAPSAFINCMSAWLADFAMQVLLACIVAVWLLGQTLLAIIICFGPLLLCFELFDRTRGFVDQWIGKIVGMTAFGLATSVLMAIMMQGLTTLMQNADGSIASSGAQAVSVMLHVIIAITLDAFTMIALPSIVGFGSGVAGSLAAPSALAVGRAVMGSNLGVVALKAGVRGASGGARNGLAKS